MILVSKGLASGETYQKKRVSPKIVRDVLLLKLSLMLIVILTHYLTNSPSLLWGFWGAEAESILGLLLILDFLLPLPHCFSADRWWQSHRWSTFVSTEVATWRTRGLKMTSLCGLLVTWSLSVSPKDGKRAIEIGIYLQPPYPIWVNLQMLYSWGDFCNSGLWHNGNNLLGNPIVLTHNGLFCVAFWKSQFVLESTMCASRIFFDHV